MKTLKKQFKLVALILSMLILFQGCTVYKSASVSLDEAVVANTKVKVKTNDNQTLKFKNIWVENGIYYGIKKSNGVIVKTQIEVDKIEKVQLKDKIISIILPIGIVFVSAVVLLWGGGSGFD